MDKKYQVLLTAAQIQHIRDALNEYRTLCEFPTHKHDMNRELVHGLWEIIGNETIAIHGYRKLEQVK